jgi:autoinducer 2-degrading protein
MYSLSVMLEIDPKHREEFRAVAAGHAANTRALEKGCLRFEVYESPEDPSRFYLHEVYADKAALTEVHDKSSYLAEYLAKTSGWVRSKVREAWTSVEL